MESDQDVIIQVIENTLEQLRPFIHAHGGNIEFVKYENAIVYIRLHGACVGCPISSFTVKLGIEEKLKEQLPEIQEVIALE